MSQRLMEKLKDAAARTGHAEGVAGIMLTQAEIEDLIKALRLSEAVWHIAKS